MSAGARLTRLGAFLVLGAIALGTALMAAAMNLYPGGNAVDHQHAGHSFWFNYLCDLTTGVAVNGAANTRGAAFAGAAMMLLSIALGIVWLVLPKILGGGRWTAPVVRFAGSLSALGLIAVPFASARLHAPVILTTVVPGVAAMSAALVGMWRARRGALLAVAGATLIAGVIGAALYAAKVAGWLALSTPAVPVFQRLAGLLLLAWMAGVSWAVLRAKSP